jgi:hypothetical protein
MSAPRPHWFKEGSVLVSAAPTCGISKSGGVLPRYDEHGRPVRSIDEDTGEMIVAVDDRLLDDVTALREGRDTDTLRFVPAELVSLRHAVPVYYDERHMRALTELLRAEELAGFRTMSVQSLIKENLITVRPGHGSAPKDVRIGDVPYIKVSDLRAGQVNINPTNRVPLRMAKRYWRRDYSGLQAFDLLTPVRASKNIGDFCVLMPGQEQILLTKEILVVRAAPTALFDQFYLLWALTLNEVRSQWGRIVFMQTNREDVGKRYLEIEIPVPPDSEAARRVSEPFRRFYRTVSEERSALQSYLGLSGAHHFHIAGA